MDMFTFNNCIFYLIWLTLLSVCWSDIRYRTIYHSQIAVLLVLILTNYFVGQGEFNYISALVFLFIGFLLFCCKWIGAGDIKLITVLLLSISTQEVWYFLVMITVWGLPLALIAVASKYYTKNKKATTLPYGVAITLSYVMVTYPYLTLINNS